LQKHPQIQRRISLGVYPDVEPKEAREGLEQARKLVASGIDPCKHTAAKLALGIASDNTFFEAVGREWCPGRFAPRRAAHSASAAHPLEQGRYGGASEQSQGLAGSYSCFTFDSVVQFSCFNTGDYCMATASGHTSAICASKVIGTNVQDLAGRKIGEVEDVVLDKQSNSILFAIVGFGGLLGVAEKYHPIPWASLTYDVDEKAYVVDYTKEQLQAAPAGSIDELTQDGGLAVRDRTYAYYKAEPYSKT
jgi:sporulation protein YlmC with PRC-barrel domain